MTTEPSGKRKLIVTPPTRNSYLICIAVMSGEEPLIDPNLFCLILIPDNNCHLQSKSQRFVMNWIWIISDTISTCRRFNLLSWWANEKGDMSTMQRSQYHDYPKFKVLSNCKVLVGVLCVGRITWMQNHISLTGRVTPHFDHTGHFRFRRYLTTSTLIILLSNTQLLLRNLIWKIKCAFLKLFVHLLNIS